MNTDGEVRWKDVPGFEGLYAASTDGRIKNLKTGKILNSRYGVVLRKDGEAVFKRTPRLILETFCGPAPSPEHVAVRLDRSVDNDRLDNLAWKTRKEFPPRQKLTKDQINSMRWLAQRGLTGAEIARRFGVTRQNVYGILQRRKWAA